MEVETPYSILQSSQQQASFVHTSPTSSPLPSNSIRAQSWIFLQIDGAVAIFSIQGDLVLQGSSHLRLELETPQLTLQS